MGGGDVRDKWHTLQQLLLIVDNNKVQVEKWNLARRES